MSKKHILFVIKQILIGIDFRAGFNGEECVLKAICETADQPFAEHNGVLGDIMHIIFT